MRHLLGLMPYGLCHGVYTSPDHRRDQNRRLEKGLRSNTPWLCASCYYCKDGSEPQSVAILHCIGSRDEKYNVHCSRAWCMWSLKFAHLVKDVTGAQVEETACKGCGTCVGHCLPKAISLSHFTDEELVAEMRGALRVMEVA